MIFEVSIDKLAIMASVSKRNEQAFASLINGFLVDTNLTKEGYEPTGKLLGDKIYFAYEPFKAKSMGRRPLRLEFNPNNLTAEDIEIYQEKILPLLSDVDVTRMDIAFDTTYPLGTFEYVQDNPTKSVLWRDRMKQTETLYFGSRESEKFIRIYNKSKEREEKEGQVLEKDKPWWRLEFELKRGSCSVLEEPGTPFDGLIIKKIDIETVQSIQDRAMLYYLRDNPNGWKELSRNTASRFKKLQKSLEGLDLTDEFKKIYINKKDELRNAVAVFAKVQNDRPKYSKL